MKFGLFCLELELQKINAVGEVNLILKRLGSRRSHGVIRWFLKLLTIQFPKIMFVVYIAALIIRNKKKTIVISNSYVIFDHASLIYRRFVDDCSVQALSDVNISRLRLCTLLFSHAREVFNLRGQISSGAVCKYMAVFVVSYLQYRDTLIYSSLEGCIVSDDFTPDELAVCALCSEYSLNISLFRVNAANNRRFFPFSVKTHFIHSKTQSGSVYAASQQVLLQKSRANNHERYGLQRSLSRERLGLALTSDYDLPRIQRCIDDFYKKLAFSSIVLKLHPSTNKGEFLTELGNLTYIDRGNYNLEIFEGDITKFTQEIDICLVGNSSASYDLALEGVLCYYNCELDFHPFDNHGWLHEGLMFDIREFGELTEGTVADCYDKLTSRLQMLMEEEP